MAERGVEHPRLLVAERMRPRHRLGGLVGDGADKQRSRGFFERTDRVERSVADQLLEIHAVENRMTLLAWGRTQGGFWTGPMMTSVVSTQHLRIEGGPPGAAFGCLASGRESVAGGPQAHQWLARRE